MLPQPGKLWRLLLRQLLLLKPRRWQQRRPRTKRLQMPPLQPRQLPRNLLRVLMTPRKLLLWPLLTRMLPQQVLMRWLRLPLPPLMQLVRPGRRLTMRLLLRQPRTPSHTSLRQHRSNCSGW
jgi:hypothetical protein